jgi:CPA1 family monovalent cation:H+ antiporter
MDLVRKDFKVRLGRVGANPAWDSSFGANYEPAYRTALASARHCLLAIRDSAEIGDDAFHALEIELDWIEVSGPLARANAE